MMIQRLKMTWELFNRRNHEKYDGIMEKTQELCTKHHHKSHRFRWTFVTSQGQAPSRNGWFSVDSLDHVRLNSLRLARLVR